MKTFKKEGKSYKISTDVLDNQSTLEVGNDTETKATINTDEFEDFKKLYADAIKNLTDIYGNLFPDLESAEDLDKALKDAFTKSKNYIPSEEMKSSGELDDKSKVEESAKIDESKSKDLNEDFYEKICKLYADAHDLEWVAINPYNDKKVYGYFRDAESAEKYKGNINAENIKTALAHSYTIMEDASKMAVEAFYWETLYKATILPKIYNDIEKSGVDNFYISKEDLEKLGFDLNNVTEESVKITESNEEGLDEAFYEKVCRAYIDTMNLEWVTTNPENNNSVVHGYFKDDIDANEYKNKITPENFKDIIYGDGTADTIEDTDFYEYDTWEDFYEEYVKDNIAYDIQDIGLDNFYISKEDLEKLGFDLSDALNEAVITKDSDISYKDWLDSKAFWVDVYDNYGCDSWTDINNRLSEDDLKSLYQKYLQDPNKNYDAEYDGLNENCHKKIERKCGRKTCKTEDLKESEKELADKFGITDNLNKLTNDLMNLDYVTNVEYDLNGYYDNMNAPITLVSFDINVQDKEYDITNYISAKTQLIKQILAVMKNNGVNVEVNEFEDNDTYFYIVAYSTNWNTEKKTESPVQVPTKEQLYDELCAVLTDYEQGPHPNASTLYDMLVKIQNYWENVITANE